MGVKDLIKKFFVDYLAIVKKVLGNKSIKFILTTLLVIIATIFINIFTSNEAIQKFTENGLPLYAQIVFYMGFGLIALISLMKSAIAIGTIIFIGLVAGIFLKLIIDIYNWGLGLIPKKKFILVAIIITLVEMAFVLLFSLGLSKGTDWWLILSFLFLILGSTTLGKVTNEIEEWKKNTVKKIYNPKKLDKEMKKKILFTIWICFLVIFGGYLCWILSDKFSLIADFKYVNIIITTAVFFAGFGMLSLSKNNEEQKDSLFAVILPNRKSITLWSILSIIFAFCYLIFESSPFSTMFFKLSVAFLFFTILLIGLLVLYSDNKYLRELETQNVPNKKEKK